MRRFAIAAGAVAVLTVGGVAFAQTTGDERIYACVNNGDGTIRQVAGPDVTCNKGSHPLSWSAENPPSQHIPVTTTYKKSQTFQMPVGVGGSSQAVNCDDGDVATGGGFSGGGSVLELEQSLPLSTPGSASPNAWGVAMGRKEFDQPWAFNIYVVCQHTE
jgi:hypothetical protein